MRYTKAIVRQPSPNFAEGVTESNMEQPDYDLAIKQHADYCKALQSFGLELIKLKADPDYPDSCFVEDTAIIVDDYAVITRLGHPSRRGEETPVAEVLSRYKKLIHIEEPGTVDGGDVMEVGDHFFIGVTRRTNEQGAAQLAEVVLTCGKSVSLVPVQRFLHLKTAMSPVNRDTMLCLEEIQEEHFEAVINKIKVPREEHCAANCLSANGFVLLPSNCPRTVQSIELSGNKVVTVDTSEFQKMDGRLTCLSILF